MKDVYNQFSKRSKRSEVTKGGNPAKNSGSILQPELPEPKLLEPKPIRTYFERWICYVCKKFESDSEEGLLKHLHEHGKYSVGMPIQNWQAFEKHNSDLERLEDILRRSGWTVAILEEPSGKFEPFRKPSPDLIALTPENVLVFLEFKKHIFDFRIIGKLNEKYLLQYADYMNWIDGTGIPMILVSSEGCWLVEQ